MKLKQVCRAGTQDDAFDASSFDEDAKALADDDDAYSSDFKDDGR